MPTVRIVSYLGNGILDIVRLSHPIKNPMNSKIVAVTGTTELLKSD